jgi:hypothetical protein
MKIITGTLCEDQCAFIVIYRSVLRKRNISDIVVEKIKTNIVPFMRYCGRDIVVSDSPQMMT